MKVMLYDKHPYDTTLIMDEYRQICQNQFFNCMFWNVMPYDIQSENDWQHWDDEQLNINCDNITNDADIVELIKQAQGQQPNIRYFLNWYWVDPYENKKDKLNHLLNITTHEHPQMYIYDIVEQKGIKKPMNEFVLTLLNLVERTPLQWFDIFTNDMFSICMSQSTIDELKQFFLNIPYDKAQEQQALFTQTSLFDSTGTEQPTIASVKSMTKEIENAQTPINETLSKEYLMFQSLIQCISMSIAAKTKIYYIDRLETLLNGLLLEKEFPNQTMSQISQPVDELITSITKSIHDCDIQGTTDYWINEQINHYIDLIQLPKNDDAKTKNNEILSNNIPMNFNGKLPQTSMWLNSMTFNQWIGYVKHKEQPYHELTTTNVETTLSMDQCADIQPFDLIVSELTNNFISNGVFTLSQLYEFATGSKPDKNKNGDMPKLYNDMYNSIEYLRTHLIGINFHLPQMDDETTTEYKKRKSTIEKELQANYENIRLNWLYRNNILPIESIERTDKNGVKTIWYHFTSTPPMYAYDNLLNRIITNDAKIIRAPFDKKQASHKLQASQQTLLLNDYLYKQVDQMSIGARDTKIRFDTLCKACAIELDTDKTKMYEQTRIIRKQIETILDTYKNINLIVDWSTYNGAKNQLIGYDIKCKYKKSISI